MEIAKLVSSGDYNPQHLALLAQAVLKGMLAEAKLAAEADADAADSALANVLADVTNLRAKK